MGKLSSFIRRAGGGSLGRMRRNIRTVHEQSGKSQVGILIDMLGCMRQGFGHLDYLTFNFAEVRDDRRNTFITMNDNIVLARRLNERDYYPVFNDKRKFNAAFRAYLGRDYVDLADGFEAFEAFVRKHPVFIAKPAEEFGGAGIQKIDAAGLSDILVVVIRYFGGIKLGIPGLIRAYKASTADALAQATVVEKVAGKDYRLSFPYLSMNAVMKVVKDMSLPQKDQYFAERCSMLLRVRLSQEAAFLDRVSNIEGVDVDEVKI